MKLYFHGTTLKLSQYTHWETGSEICREVHVAGILTFCLAAQA